MDAPEITYAYAWPKDIAGSTIELIHRRDATTANNAIIIHDLYVIPDDKLFILLSAQILSQTSGAGVTFFNHSLRFRSPTGVETKIYEDLAPSAVATAVSSNVTSRGWGPPGWTIRQQTFFSAADVTNFAQISVQGLLIPRANVALLL